MSKRVFPIGVTAVVLLALVLAVFPAAADPHHLTSAASASCSGYNVTADYVGGSGTRRVVWNVTVTVDGTPTNYSGDWQGASPGFDLFTASGGGAHDVQATGHARLYERERTGWGSWHDGYSWESGVQNDWEWSAPWWGWRHRHPVYDWVQVDSESFNLNFVSQCYQPCDEQVAGTAPSTEYGEWSEWAFNVGLDLWERFRSVITYSVPMLDARDGSVCVPAVPTPTTERDTREPVIAHEVYAQADCDGWVVLEQAYKDGVADGNPVALLSGEWSKPYALEQATPEGLDSDGDPFAFTIDKGEGCLECKWTAVYPMSIYYPANPPQSYWRGPFDNAACAVIHKDGQVPAADRVTMLCSLCPEQYEGGFIFNAINKPYTGWLYKVECYGEPTTFVFADGWHEFEWDEDWVRKGFKADGERCDDNPRVEGCSGWIHEEAGIPYWDPLNPEGSQ